MIEEGTEFARRGITPCAEELDLAQYQEAQGLLQGAGLLQYEISNFARPGFACKHNLVYWHNEPYLGLGAAAVSYLNNERRTNVNDVPPGMFSCSRKDSVPSGTGNRQQWNWLKPRR